MLEGSTTGALSVDTNVLVRAVLNDDAEQSPRAITALIAAGGDFADGLIAYEGNWLGGESFVSCDKKGMTLLNDQGQTCISL